MHIFISGIVVLILLFTVPEFFLLGGVILVVWYLIDSHNQGEKSKEPKSENAVENFTFDPAKYYRDQLKKNWDEKIANSPEVKEKQREIQKVLDKNRQIADREMEQERMTARIQEQRG